MTRSFTEELIAGRRAYLDISKTLKAAKQKPVATAAKEPPTLKAVNELRWLAKQVKAVHQQHNNTADFNRPVMLQGMMPVPAAHIEQLQAFRDLQKELQAMCPQFTLEVHEQAGSYPCRVVVQHPGISRAEFRNPLTKLSPFKRDWLIAIMDNRQRRLRHLLAFRKQVVAYSQRLQKYADNLAAHLERNYTVDGRDEVLLFQEFLNPLPVVVLKRLEGYRALVAAAQALDPAIRVWVKEPDFSGCKLNVAIHIPGLPRLY